MKEWYVTELSKGNAHDHFQKSSSLGAAKHRHDSWSDPAVQWVMTTAAMQATAQRATVHFSTSDPLFVDCKAFLDGIKEVVVFDMGLLTDALCECQLVVRHFDEDRPSIRDQIPIVRHWRHRLKYLYLDDPPGCMSSMCTYTRVAMDFLGKGPHAITVRGRIVREYGGTGSLTPHMIETSLARMVRYVHANDAVLAAEYPDFELVGAFFIFKIEGQIHNGGRRNLWLAEDHRFIEQCIKRLATAFSVSESDLRCQLDSLLSLATEIFKQGCTEEEAIIKAWQIRKKNGMCLDAVSEPLWRSLAWGLTTSDIERDFSLERRLFPHRSHCCVSTRFRIMRLASRSPSTCTTDDFKWVVGRAQDLWFQQPNGSTRQLRTFDARKGQKRKCDSDPQVSKASWKRNRTITIDKDASSSAPPSICPKLPKHVPGTSATTVAFNKELEFNTSKYHKKKVQAMQLGTLIALEKSPEFVIAAERDIVRQQKSDKARKNKETALARRVKAFDMPISEVMAKPIYVSTNIGPSEHDNVKAKLASFYKVSNLMDACVVVSSTLVLNQMGDRLACAVMLCGMSVVMPGFIFGNSKACLTCRPAIETRRRLFLSEGIRAKHAGLVNVISDAARRPTSKYKLLETLEEYKGCLIRASNNSKKQFVVVARRGEDIADIDVGGKRLTKDQFMRSIEFVDVNRTRGTL